MRNFKALNVSRRYMSFYWSHVVALLLEALRYKPGGRWFDFRWGHRNFSLT